MAGRPSARRWSTTWRLRPPAAQMTKNGVSRGSSAIRAGHVVHRDVHRTGHAPAGHLVRPHGRRRRRRPGCAQRRSRRGRPRAAGPSAAAACAASISWRTASMSSSRAWEITPDSACGGRAPAWLKRSTPSRNSISVGIEVIAAIWASCCSASVSTLPKTMSGMLLRRPSRRPGRTGGRVRTTPPRSRRGRCPRRSRSARSRPGSAHACSCRPACHDDRPTHVGEPHQPRARHSSRWGRSLPSTPSPPWPG